ncbi:transcription factor EMB1444-like isoform X2 [Actinidia eriantha]|uniref:transcription factor EMB1444-like isoform X2 n=1 Tax=Actinidia eriantha TaxID=165200 RepID=UPI0025888F33|nr:transcription factor EMB1444-like isoform X2 [Actinidia eriantha]
MGAHLHHALKAFCSDTEWKYAVFWKLKHQARMFVGQVAVTRKRMWIFADKLVTDSCSPFENYDGWQTQFSSGIKIPENFKVVTISEI